MALEVRAASMTGSIRLWVAQKLPFLQMARPRLHRWLIIEFLKGKEPVNLYYSRFTTALDWDSL